MNWHGLVAGRQAGSAGYKISNLAAVDTTRCEAGELFFTHRPGQFRSQPYYHVISDYSRLVFLSVYPLKVFECPKTDLRPTDF